MQVNYLKFIKIYAHLIIACIKFTPTSVILIDRKNPDKQLHCDRFSIKRKYFYKEVVEIMRINFNQHLQVEKINSLRLLFINVLQTQCPKSQQKEAIIFPSPGGGCIAHLFRKYILSIYYNLSTVR